MRDRDVPKRGLRKRGLSLSLESPAGREGKKRKRKKESGEEKREKENYRGKGNGQIIISGPG